MLEGRIQKLLVSRSNENGQHPQMLADYCEIEALMSRGQVEAIEIHHFAPRRHEVFRKLLL